MRWKIIDKFYNGFMSKFPFWITFLVSFRGFGTAAISRALSFATERHRSSPNQITVLLSKIRAFALL